MKVTDFGFETVYSKENFFCNPSITQDVPAGTGWQNPADSSIPNYLYWSGRESNESYSFTSEFEYTLKVQRHLNVDGTRVKIGWLGREIYISESLPLEKELKAVCRNSWYINRMLMLK